MRKICAALAAMLLVSLLAASPAGAWPFSDVAEHNTFRDDIEWLSSSGVTSGFPDGSFRPGASITRQAMAAFLYRYSHGGADAPGCTSQWFVDVSTNNAFCGHITWLAGTGITTGFGDGSFRPGEPITRQAMAAFLHRYRAAVAAAPAPCTEALFSDMPGGPFCYHVTWLNNTGVTTGFGNGTFRPGEPITRQAMAAFLHRFDGSFGPAQPPIVVQQPPPPPPPPPPPGPPSNPGDTKNCNHFPNWRAAQDWYEFYLPYYGDISKLDGDNDGIACESLPGAP